MHVHADFRINSYHIRLVSGSPVHVAPACAGSDHFGSDVCSLSLHFCKRLFPGLEPMVNLFLNEIELSPFSYDSNTSQKEEMVKQIQLTCLSGHEYNGSGVTASSVDIGRAKSSFPDPLEAIQLNNFEGGPNTFGTPPASLHEFLMIGFFHRLLLPVRNKG
jgi:hypothetical protein